MGRRSRGPRASSVLPLAVCDREAIADHEVVDRPRSDLVTIAPSLPSSRERGVRPLRPGEVVEGRDRPRIDTGDLGLLVTVDERLVEAHARRDCERPAPRDSVSGRRRERVEAVLRSDDVVGVHLLAHARPALESRNAAPSTATTVTSARPIMSAAAVDAVRDGLRIAFSRASSPGRPPTRSAGQPTTAASGLHEPGSEQGDPEEERERPDTEQEEHGLGLQPGRGEGDREDHDRDGDRRERDVRSVGGEARRRQASRPRAPPRSAARGSPGGPARCSRRTVTVMPIDEAHHDRPRGEDGAGLRQVDADRDEERVQPLPHAEAEEQPDHRREEADDEPLEDDGREHLASRAAERPQRCELPRALRDGDRERVEDDERADEEGDRRRSRAGST